MRNLSKSGVANLYLILAILLGGWVRFYGPGVAGFPVNDGGMFYVMIRDLQ
jgi:hypothetical protein